MLFEKKTLFGLLVAWFTGCSAVSPGHWPFCARASTSVPGAPASSLVTGSQVLVLKPGVEICAPDWVATALLCTAQPPEPRLVMSLAPVLGCALSLTAVARAGGCPRPCAAAPADVPEISQASVVTDTTATAQRAGRGRTICLIAGNSSPRGRCRERRAPPLNS